MRKAWGLTAAFLVVALLCVAADAPPGAEPAPPAEKPATVAPTAPAPTPPAPAVNPVDRYGFKSHAVLDAVNAFVISERRLHEAYANGVIAARDRLLSDLDVQQKKMTRENNLEEAARIGVAIEAIKAGDLPTQELATLPAPSVEKKATPDKKTGGDAAVERTKKTLANTRWTHAYTIDKWDKTQLEKELREFDMTLHADGSLTLVEYGHDNVGTWTVDPDKPDHVTLKWKGVGESHGGETQHIDVVSDTDRGLVLLDMQGKPAHYFVGR